MTYVTVWGSVQHSGKRVSLRVRVESSHVRADERLDEAGGDEVTPSRYSLCGWWGFSEGEDGARSARNVWVCLRTWCH